MEARLDRREIAAWLRLTQADGVGPETCRKLLAAFGLPEQIFEAGTGQLGQIVSERIVRALQVRPDAVLESLIEKTCVWLEAPENHFLTLADAQYPQRLLDVSDPPPVLYAKGRLEILNHRALAIVGSRNATAQGLANAERFAEALSQAGWSIVSGLALGIDASAHTGALRGCGSTIAVVGTGLDIVYPARNRSLAHRIVEPGEKGNGGGVMISEFPLGVPAIAHNFPRRNRIISGLSHGVLVIEAAAQSGSLITARLAAEQGREVFALPGSIHSPLSKGCHRLIKDGAKLVESAQDILEELGTIAVASVSQEKQAPVTIGNAESESALTDAQAQLLQIIGHEPVLPDDLAQRYGLSQADLSMHLLELELAGQISRLPGGRIQRLHR